MARRKLTSMLRGRSPDNVSASRGKNGERRGSTQSGNQPNDAPACQTMTSSAGGDPADGGGEEALEGRGQARSAAFATIAAGWLRRRPCGPFHWTVGGKISAAAAGGERRPPHARGHSAATAGLNAPTPNSPGAVPWLKRVASPIPEFWKQEFADLVGLFEMRNSPTR